MNILSFSLFGAKGKYIEGALQNAVIAPHLYPDWTMRVYHDNSVPSTTIGSLKRLGCQTVDMTGHFASPIFWRFLANDDPNVERWLSRDCDSRLNYRERRCVDAWISSGRKFHVIKDHPGHEGEFPILAGTFGCAKGLIPNMEQLIRSFGKFDHWTDDQHFLKAFVWPLVHENLLYHDQFGSLGVKAPISYENYRYVGEPFDDVNPDSCNQAYRQQLIDAIVERGRHFHHVASIYEAKGEEQRRNLAARSTWTKVSDANADFHLWRFEDCEMKRSSKMLGDTKSVPFFKDIIEWVVADIDSDDDVIVFTNADNCLPENTVRVLQETFKKYPACVSQRYNYARIEHGDWKECAKDSGGQFLPGFDLFAFTCGWWKANKDKVADMLIGYEAWDCMLECVVRWNGGAILPEPIVYHEHHDQHWHQNRLSSPGQQFNLRSFCRWAFDSGHFEEVKERHSYSFEAITQLFALPASDLIDFSVALDKRASAR